MKEMIYSDERTTEVLHSGTYKNHKFGIVSFGTHPCAYVENKVESLADYNDERLGGVDVHGGFTFYGERKFLGEGIKYLGWDYSHYGDRYGCSMCFCLGEREYNTAEMYSEVKSVIDQLIEIEEN